MEMETNDVEGSSTEIESEGTDMETSDIELEIDANVDENAVQNEVREDHRYFQYHPERCRMDEYLHTNWTASDWFLTTLAKETRHNATYESIVNIMKVFSAGFENKSFPKNKPTLWNRLNRDFNNLKHSVYCCVCKSSLGNSKNPEFDCECGRCGPGKNKQHLGHLIHIDLYTQIKQLLEQPHMKNSLNYRNTRKKWNENGMEDVYDGKIYQILLELFLANPNNLSFTLWLDGVQVSKSSKASAVPILLMINELPPHARKKHMILAGVWTGYGKPDSNEIIEFLVEDLRYLYRHGVSWTPFEGGDARTSKFVTCVLSCDTEARYDVLCMTRHNGKSNRQTKFNEQIEINEQNKVNKQIKVTKQVTINKLIKVNKKMKVNRQIFINKYKLLNK